MRTRGLRRKSKRKKVSTASHQQEIFPQLTTQQALKNLHHPDSVLHLQQRIGNQGVQRLIQEQGDVSPTKHIQRFMGKSKKRPAKFLGMNLSAKEITVEGAKGHEMDFLIHADFGKKPVGETYDAMDVMNQKAHSLFGIQMEYWEQIDVPYDFKADDTLDSQTRKDGNEGAHKKNWSDIYQYNPAAMSFRNYIGQGGDMSWGTAVETAANGTLTGTKNISVVDKPRAGASEGRTFSRTLKFRVVLKDMLGNRQEIYATQVIEVENGVYTYVSYSDSMGNSLVTSPNDAEAVRHDSAFFLGDDYPPEVLNSLHEFAYDLQTGNADDFANHELNGLAINLGQPVPGDFSQLAEGSDLGNAYRDVNRGGGTQMEGIYGAPIIRSGEKIKEFDAGGGKLLVAVMHGKEIVKLYFTDNTAVESLHFKNYINEFDLPVRKFSEIPVEFIQNIYQSGKKKKK